MTQKFYLRSTTGNSFPTAGEKSTTEPVAASTWTASGGLIDRDLLAAKSTTVQQLFTSCATNATTNPQNGILGRWTSVALAAGTYGAGTWTFAVQDAENNGSANGFHASASIYFWRPGTSSVVGFVIDSDTAVGAEVGGGAVGVPTGLVLSMTGSNVTIQDGDVLVIEAWYKQTQAMGVTYSITIFWDGTTDVTAGYLGTDPASYLQAPADIPEFTAPVVRVPYVRPMPQYLAR